MVHIKILIEYLVHEYLVQIQNEFMSLFLVKSSFQSFHFMVFQFQPNLKLFDPFIGIRQIFGIPFVLFDVESMGLVFEVRGKIRRFGENRMITKANEPKPFLVHRNGINILILLGLWIVFWAIGGFYGQTHVKYLCQYA